MEFYSVKHRKKVEVSDKDIRKKTYGEGTSLRYAAVASTNVDGDKVNLTKFINKATYDGLNVPEDKGK
ncbi:MAG: hypothetical protein J0I20_09005 [Chloroflexi bacterium]|nr:hypothetical protein [Chloroflexota bacterium]OJV97009.1 MAG: hypothetical protein BGO39_18535 [Chloroflexi bacterium 54-19]